MPRKQLHLMPSVYHKYHDHKFSQSHQGCVITTMHVLIKFKGTTVTSKIVKQKRKSRRYQNTQEKLSLVKTKKATDVTGPDFLYTCLVTESNNPCPTVEIFVKAYQPTESMVLGASSFYCASLSVEPNRTYLILLSSHYLPAFKVSR